MLIHKNYKEISRRLPGVLLSIIESEEVSAQAIAGGLGKTPGWLLSKVYENTGFTVGQIEKLVFQNRLNLYWLCTGQGGPVFPLDFWRNTPEGRAIDLIFKISINNSFEHWGGLFHSLGIKPGEFVRLSQGIGSLRKETLLTMVDKFGANVLYVYNPREAVPFYRNNPKYLTHSN